MRSKKLQSELDKLWTCQDLRRRLRVKDRAPSMMTIHLWRKHKGLPSIVIKGDSRPSVRFVPEEVRSWAKQAGLTLV